MDITFQTWLANSVSTLNAAGIGTARLDALVLAEDVLGKNRAYLLAHDNMLISPDDTKKLNELVARRAKHEPLAYIRAKTEFYGREFALSPVVLEPRPESETMIELLKKLPLNNKPVIVDVGTGSGAIGITAALEIPESQVILTDIDDGCLQVSRQNCDRYHLKLDIIKDDLLAHAAKRGTKPDVILANLPYVPDHYTINEAALQEPRIAIFGGSDGLDLYRRLFTQLDTLKAPYVLTESLPFQHHDLAIIAAEHGYAQANEDDFIQLFAKN